jgi:hypothetical protein
MSALSRTAELVHDIAAAIDAAHAMRLGLPVSARARRRVAAARSVPRPCSLPTIEPSGRRVRTHSDAWPQQRPLRGSDQSAGHRLAGPR